MVYVSTVQAMPFPLRPPVNWRGVVRGFGTMAVVGLQSAAFAATIWVLVAAPGFCG